MESGTQLFTVSYSNICYIEGDSIFDIPRMQMSGSKLSYWLKGLVIIDVIGLIVAAVWFVQIQQFLSTAIKTTGHIRAIVAEIDGEGDPTYTPEIEFQDQHGKLYRLRTIVSGNEGDHQVGESVPVVYDPRDASKASVDSLVELYLGVFIVSLVSLLMLFAGSVIWWLFNKEEKRKLDLLNNGQRISAIIVEIIHMTSIKRRGQSPWMVSATWTNPLDNKKYDFTSELVWSDPKQYLGSGTINAYIDPNDPEQYYLEVPQPLTGNV